MRPGLVLLLLWPLTARSRGSTWAGTPCGSGTTAGLVCRVYMYGGVLLLGTWVDEMWDCPYTPTSIISVGQAFRHIDVDI